MKVIALLVRLMSVVSSLRKRKAIKVLMGFLPLVMFASLLSGCHLNQMGGVINPRGLVAAKQARLMMDALALMMIVVIPVIVMSFLFAWKYRKSSKQNPSYKPNWSHSNTIEAVCWGVPCIIIIILGVMTWVSSHKLDPYRRLAVPGKILRIEAVSLRWKWLFIYPKQKIATVNYITIPKDTQVEFWITSDAPMSAFFIPQLGSQIYSMAGMRTRLHLISDHNGVYEGLNTQFNGDGFSDMHFKVRVADKTDFDDWVKKVKDSKKKLDLAMYKKIVKPSVASPVMYFSTVYPDLFQRIMEQYTKPNMDLH